METYLITTFGSVFVKPGQNGIHDMVFRSCFRFYGCGVSPTLLSWSPLFGGGSSDWARI